MRDNIEVEGQIKRRGKKFSKRLDSKFSRNNTKGDVAEFPNVRSFSRNIFAKV